MAQKMTPSIDHERSVDVRRQEDGDTREGYIPRNLIGLYPRVARPNTAAGQQQPMEE